MHCACVSPSNTKLLALDKAPITVGDKHITVRGGGWVGLIRRLPLTLGYDVSMSSKVPAENFASLLYLHLPKATLNDDEFTRIARSLAL